MTKLADVLGEQGRQPKWLARKVGVRTDQTYRWIRGEAVPRDEHKKAIAKLLGVTVGWLFFDESVVKKGIRVGGLEK